MSLKNLDIETNFMDSEYEFQMVVSEVLLPFSKSKCEDLYTGEERIPFSKRDLEYQKILKEEFL